MSKEKKELYGGRKQVNFRLDDEFIYKLDYIALRESTTRQDWGGEVLQKAVERWEVKNGPIPPKKK